MNLVRIEKAPRGGGDESTNEQQANASLPLMPPNASVGAFPHEKLDAYRVAVEMARGAKALVEQIPRGHSSIADHLRRSASNTVLLLAEGANRRGSAEKRQRFVESRGEAGETAAACDLVIALELGPPSLAHSVKQYAARLAAMLTKLIQRLP
jgi:four helix bundle protein